MHKEFDDLTPGDQLVVGLRKESWRHVVGFFEEFAHYSGQWFLILVTPGGDYRALWTRDIGFVTRMKEPDNVE